MNRIIWHHTGGPYLPSADDRRVYHRLIDRDGVVWDGSHAILANAAGKALVAGRYAAHCLKLNSGSIGLAICALKAPAPNQPVEWARPFASTPCPVLPGQVDALVAETARLCALYGITPDRRTVLSHAEVEPTLGVKQKGKWDFDYWPRGSPGPRDPIAIGDELRAEVRRALTRDHILPQPTPSTRPTLQQGATGPAVRELQTLLGVTADEIFGPQTRAAVVAYQGRRQLLPDGIVGRMTWAALAVQ